MKRRELEARIRNLEEEVESHKATEAKVDRMYEVLYVKATRLERKDLADRAVDIPGLIDRVATLEQMKDA